MPSPTDPSEPAGPAWPTNPAKRAKPASKLPAPADPVKDMLSAAVLHYLVNTGPKVELLPMPPNVLQLVAYGVDPGLMRIKVYTEDVGVRQFSLRLTEDARPTNDGH
jgi:hypothetical protein